MEKSRTRYLIHVVLRIYSDFINGTLSVDKFWTKGIIKTYFKLQIISVHHIDIESKAIIIIRVFTTY